MYNLPSKRRIKRKLVRPNLIPILDAVFIFIFFLLMSVNFLRIFEISSNVPIISDKEIPKSKKPPLALTLDIKKDAITVYTGVPATQRETINNLSIGVYNLERLHSIMLRYKKKNPLEKTVIFEPASSIPYESIVQIMDSVRLIRNLDPDFYVKDKDGINIKVKELFSDIIFGNIQS